MTHNINCSKIIHSPQIETIHEMDADGDSSSMFPFFGFGVY